MISKTWMALVFFSFIIAMPCAGQATDDAKKQREEFEQKAKESLDERIQTFLKDLTNDDFQKEIIKQKLNSYFEHKKALFLDTSMKYYERDEKVAVLGNTHFSDIENMVSEDTMSQIKIFITDVGTTLEKQKKKKLKTKKRNKQSKEKTNE